MDDYDPKNTPIKFKKTAKGEYLSECGRYRIYLTVHTGRLYGRGARRWWIVDAKKGDKHVSGTLGKRGDEYELTLGDAIEQLHRIIGRGVRDAFEPFAERAKQLASERAAEEERKRRAKALGSELVPLLEGFGVSAQAAYGVARELVSRGWYRTTAFGGL